jgi:hypothetical protein
MLESTAPINSKLDGKAGRVTRRIARIDGRSRSARRIKALVAAYTAALDGAADATVAAKILKAAELTALCEQLRAAALRGEAVDPLALIRFEGVADRAVRQLGPDIRKSIAAATALPTIADLLRSGIK